MEAYNLPIKLREWFVKRLKKQLDAEAEAMSGASKGGKGSTSLGPGSNAPPPRGPSK
jgi:hypothetical protein